jgi:hypothetical protein
VFDARSSAKFSPAEQCPAYSVPQEIASAVHNKERRDEFAQFVIHEVLTVATTTRGQGGLNAIFLAALKDINTGWPGSRLAQGWSTIVSGGQSPHAMTMVPAATCFWASYDRDCT